MASTYSNLKIQLMATGENTGTWGTITNTNLGTALEEAIVGSADVTFSSGDVTLSLTDTNSSQTARNLRLNLTGTVSAAQNLVVPAIEKIYLVNNTLSYAITVKNSTGTGIAVPAGKTMWVYNNGTNVVDAVNHLTSLTLASALPIASGGTGTNSTTFCNLQANVTGVLPVANGGTGVNASTGTSAVVLNTSPTISSATLTGTPIAPTASNGTNTTQIATTAFVNNSVTIATAALGTMSTQNANAVAITGGTITGITDLAVADGGTGASSITANSIILGNGTSALSGNLVAPSTAGNMLVSNGTTWVSKVFPAFSAYLSGNQSLGGSTTKVNFDTEAFDTNSNFNTSNARFTPTVAGYYQINFGLTASTWSDSGSYGSGNMGAVLYKNGAEYTWGNVHLSAYNWSCVVTGSALVYMNGSTDYLEIYGYATGGDTSSVKGGATDASIFSGFLAVPA